MVLDSYPHQLPMRDHVFISYAVEQAPLAEWLARRLASLGYAVWMDRLKLLGGEPWPEDIQQAIRERTICMLALLSKASQAKRNPTGEWLVALAVGKQLSRPDFLIPLKVEEMDAAEITFAFQTINYIPFTNGWAAGLAAVVKKLESIDVPRSLDRGPELASIFYNVDDLVRQEPEVLRSNALLIKRVPAGLHRFDFISSLSNSMSRETSRVWPHYWVSTHRAYSFQHPPREIESRFHARHVGSASWRHVGERDVDGVQPRHMVAALIRRSIEGHLASKQMAWDDARRHWYFPSGLLEGDWLRFTHPDLTRGRLLAVGTVTLRSRGRPRPLRHHLSPSLDLLRDAHDPYLIVLRLRVHITESDGRAVDERSQRTARKKLCKRWWNYDWLSRVLGVCEFLSTSPGEISIGSLPEEAIVIDGVPLAFHSPLRLDETRADPIDPESIIERDDLDEDEDAEVEVGA
jgi:hypothetical protein